LCSSSLIIGAVYIPPENSKYSRRDAFSLIELEIQGLNYDEKHVISMHEPQLRQSFLTLMTYPIKNLKKFLKAWIMK
jgi:hypothetical protein